MKKYLSLSFLLLLFLLSSCMKDHTNDSPLLGVSVGDVVLHSDETQKVIEVQSTFAGILSRTEDVSTKQEASWLKVVLGKGKITLNLEENISITDRQAKVTLYMGPNRDNVSDPDLEVEFLVTQKMNDQFEGLNISELVMSSVAGDSTIVLSKNIKNARVQIQSVDDSESVNWCSARINSGTELTVKVSEHKSRGVRQALVRLLPGNNKVQTDSLTATTAFLVTQLQNTVFDGFNTTDVRMPSEASEATLNFDNELTGVKSVMVDSATNETPKWLTLKFEGKKVLLTAKANASLTDRKAKVTLYYPNKGTTIDSTTIQTTFNVRQGKKNQIVLEKSSLTVTYEAQTVELTVTSNVGITIQGTAINENRISISGYHVEGTTHKIILSFKENKTEEILKDTLHLVSSTNSSVKADLFISQKTNPAITLFDGESKNWSFRKDGGQFQLLVNTLTPDYKVEKKADWITVGGQIRQDKGKYYHLITIKPWGKGEGPLRTDTIYVKNAEVTKKFVVSQDKYLYLSESEVLLEVGKTHQLHVTNKTSNSVVWSSGNSSIASVNSNGLITANKRGSTQIKASIGRYKDIDDYNDKCTVKVFDATDSVVVTRNYGEYVKTNGYVTSDCPITIHNYYHQSVTLTSVKIVGDDGSTILEPTSPTINNNVLKTGSSLVVNFPKLNHVYKPQVELQFKVAGGQTYSSQTDY